MQHFCKNFFKYFAMSQEKIQRRNVISARLAVALKKAGVSPKDVAVRLGVPQRTAYSWTQNVEPKSGILEILVKEFGLNPVYLLTGQGEPLLEKAKGTDVVNLVALVHPHDKKKLQMRKNFLDGVTKPL